MNREGTYTIQSIAEKAWAIDMQGVRAFLVTGSTSALLIDTGPGGVNLRQAVLSQTDLPVRIVNTHSHFDHISGNAAFEMRFAHPMEIASLAKAGFDALPVSPGSGFDLGGRILQVVGLPGHSPGSIGLWDTEAGVLFAGDAVAKGRPVFLSMDGASLEAFIRTMDLLLSMEQTEDGSRLERIFCAHGELECGLDTVEALRDLAMAYAGGGTEKAPLPEKFVQMMPADVGIVRQGDVSLLVS